MATSEMEALRKELQQAKAKGKTNKVKAIEAKIRTLKQSQKAERASSAPVPVNQVLEEKVSNIVTGVPDTYDISQFDQYMPEYNQQAYDTAWDAVFKNATRNVDQDYERDKEAEIQRLADTGIPVGSDLYNNQVKEINDRYDAIKEAARNQATASAAGEAQRLFELQQSTYNNKLGAYNMQFDKPFEFSNHLSGLTARDFAMMQADKEFQENVRQFGKTVALEKWKTKQALKGRGGGGGGGTPDTSPLLGGDLSV